MRTWGRRRLGILAHALVGAILGAALGFWLGRAMLLRGAKNNLFEYTQELTRRGDELNQEINDIFKAVRVSRLPFCSDQDIADLQARTFHSRELKDIGRTREGRLYCSAFLGRLAHPFVEGPPTVVLANGMNVYANAAVVIASPSGDHGTILESGDADIVLGANAFANWERPNVRYMVGAIRGSDGKFVEIAGSTPKVAPERLLSQRMATITGTLYSSRCSDANPVCAVTAEDLADIFSKSRGMQMAWSVMGGVAGLGIGFAVGLLYLQSNAIAAQLHRCLRKNSPSLQLLYQPILDNRTRRLAGAEALIRWKDEDGVAVQPDVFVKIAEEKGFIGELTAFVVRRSFQEMGALLRANPELTLSVNIDVSDLNRESLLALLEEQVHMAGIQSSQIILELTERSTADLALVSKAIRRLRREGYRIHIDDFGTGFSSLSYLDKLAVNAIKIDRAFTQSTGTDAVTASIMPQMLAMAETLGLEVIVEGVETVPQSNALDAMGKPIKVQGWYFARPMTAELLTIFHEQCEPVDQPVSLALRSQ